MLDDAGAGADSRVCKLLWHLFSALSLDAIPLSVTHLYETILFLIYFIIGFTWTTSAVIIEEFDANGIICPRISLSLSDKLKDLGW